MKYLNGFKNNKTLILIVIIASFLRLYHLDFQSIWVDEIHTMIEANPKLSFGESSDIILFREGTPRFYFFLVKIINTLIGHSVYNVRLLSVFFGVLSVLFIYKIGKKLFNANVGLFSAVFLTFNLFLIEYAQEARTYSMLVFFVILGFYSLISFLNDRNYKNSVFLGISLGLITNAHPFGLINVATVYLILLYVLFTEKESKIDLFKKMFVSGIIFILVFLPVIPTILTVSEFTSFWIIKPNPAYLFQIFNQLLGSSLIFTCLFVVIYFVYIFKSLQRINQKEENDKNKYLLSFIVINGWIWFEIAVILFKSYFGISIALNRYFIAIVPAFVLIIAVTIDFIKNDILKQLVVLALATYLLIDIFLIKDFYSVPRKSQFDKVANYVIKNNQNKYNVVSSFGWLMSYYYNETNEITTTEKSLNAHVDEMRNGLTNPSSFWYVDGNANVFNLSPENQDYINKNFIIKNKYNAHDAWCIAFKSKHNESTFIELKKFKPSMFDGSGAMIFVENKSSKYPKIDLEKGEYQLLIKGFSLPAKPINGENAHFNILVNGKKVKSLYLNNVPNQQPEPILIPHQGGPFNLELVYDNDLTVGSDDRNAVINSISLNKKK